MSVKENCSFAGVTVEESGQFQRRYQPGQAIVYLAADLEFAAHVNPWRFLVLTPGPMKFSIVAMDEVHP